MPGTANFSLVKEFSSPDFTRASVFNQFADQVDTLLREMEQAEETLVQVRNMVSDVAQAGAPPGATINGDAWVVDTWGAGVYVGTFVGAFADGDIAEYSDALVGWVRVLANVGGIPVLNAQVIVKAAGAAGSFAAQANAIASYNGRWNFETPTDGRRALVIGEQTVFENQTFIYDLVTAGWYSLGVTVIPNPTVWEVNKGGNDDTGSGAIERPYLTIAAAIADAAFAAGDTIAVGPGVYAETLALVESMNIVEKYPGTVTIQDAVVGGAVVTLTPAAAGMTVRLFCNVINTNNATVADDAVALNNVAGVGVGILIFNGEVLNGGALGTALRVTGDNAANTELTQAYIDKATITGGMVAILEVALDIVRYNNTPMVGGAAAWHTISGPAGRYILANVLQLAAAAAEAINFGAGTASGVILGIGSSVVAGTLNMNTSGTGIAVLTAGSEIGQVIATLPGTMHRWYGSNELGITRFAVDLNAIATTLMYTVPAGRVFCPHTARSNNRTVASGAALVYQIDGTGAASVVAAVGAAALALGCKNEVVVIDAMVAAATLLYNVTTASAVGGDLTDAEVIGYLY